MNVELARDQAEHLFRPESLSQQLAALREEHDELAASVEQLARSTRASFRGVQGSMERVERRVSQLAFSFEAGCAGVQKQAS